MAADEQDKNTNLKSSNIRYEALDCNFEGMKDFNHLIFILKVIVLRFSINKNTKCFVRA